MIREPDKRSLRLAKEHFTLGDQIVAKPEQADVVFATRDIAEQPRNVDPVPQA